MQDLFQETINRKKSAKKRGIEYNIMPLTLSKLKNESRCYYLNVALNVKNVRFKRNTKFTIDRKNPDNGYVKGNVVACSDIANQLKNLVESGLITCDDIIECGRKIKQALNS